MFRLDTADENGIIKVNADEVFKNYYMDYAKSVIVDRSFPHIDGFKPSTRRIIYTMNTLKAYNKKARKCARIVGDTMGRFHPHGDSSIYGALVNMVDVHETLNAPLIKGVGSFGKSWSTEHFIPAAMRYTEASLTELAEKEFFIGINENAVDMLDNFSLDEKEPRLLPVTFPNILVNNTNGIAVGMSTYIPTYPLKNVCQAVKAIINNPNIDVAELSDILGAPDFCTGGNIHISEHQKKNLVLNGAAKGIYLTGSYSMSKNQITIYELPYNTNVERFISELMEAYKAGLLKGVRNISNTSGRSSKTSKKDNSKCKLKVEIELSKQADPVDIMRKIRQNTSFSNPISFYTKFVWWNPEIDDYEYKECGVFELLNEYWIPWRVETLRRMNTFRMEKLKDRRHLLGAWQKIFSYLDDIIAYARTHTKAEYKVYLMSKYKLDEDQAEHIMSKRLYHLTTDEAEASFKEIKELDDKISKLFKLVNSTKLLKDIILEDMDRIISKYSSDRRCNNFDLELIESDKEDKNAKEEIQNVPVWVGITKSGGLKRAMTYNDSLKFEGWAGDNELLDVIECMNKDTLMVFTSSGYCYKVPVHAIETSRTTFKDSIWKLVQRSDDERGEIILVRATNDFKGTFTILYREGHGIVVPYNAVSGPRSRYKSIYPAFENNKTGRIYWPNRFFVVTQNDCAAFMDLTKLKENAELHGKIPFKLPRWKYDDALRGFISDKEIALFDVVQVDRFIRDYCVKMKNDKKYILNEVTERYDAEKSEFNKMIEEERERLEKERQAALEAEALAEEMGVVEE